MLIFPIKGKGFPARNFAVMTNKELQGYHGQRAAFSDASFCDWELGLVGCAGPGNGNLYLTHIRNSKPILFLMPPSGSFTVSLPPAAENLSIIVERWEGKQIEVVGKRFGCSMSDLALSYDSNGLVVSPSPFRNTDRYVQDLTSFGPREQTVYMRVPYTVAVVGHYQMAEQRKRFIFFTKCFQYIRNGEVLES